MPRVLLYAGNMDGSMCNSLGYGRVAAGLRWRGAAAFRNATRCTWQVDGRPAGVLQSDPEGRLTWATLLNSGHLVPWSVPRAAHEMIARLVGSGWGGGDTCGA